MRKIPNFSRLWLWAAAALLGVSGASAGYPELVLLNRIYRMIRIGSGSGTEKKGILSLLCAFLKVVQKVRRMCSMHCLSASGLASETC